MTAPLDSAPRLPTETVEAAVAEARAKGWDRDLQRLLAWGRNVFGKGLMMSTAFGKSGMVILHHLKDNAPEVPVYFLDTGFHFRETMEYLERLRDEWGLDLRVQQPRLMGVDFVRKHGEALWERDPDRCCHMNKVEPFRELFGDRGRYQGWITGVRRDQSSTRSEAEPIEILEGNLVKLQPLAYWTRDDVQSYLARHAVPLHPLFAQGYASIGCEPCTRPSGDSTNERAGRWAGKAKTECGLQTFWKKKREAAAEDTPQEESGGAASAR